jgi:sugar transferase (PEP-CTERM/EpsH1 system associated)
MDLLFVSLRFPYPPNRGDTIRAYFLLRGLARRHRVSLVTFHEHAPDAEGERALRETCAHVWKVPFHRRVGQFNAAAHLGASTPLQNHLWYSTNMARTIGQALDRVAPDALQVQFFRMGQYVADVPVPRVLDLGDAMGLNLRNRLRREYNPLVRALVGAEARRVTRYEAEISRRFDRTTLVSLRDRQALQEVVPDVSFDIIPNGVDLQYFSTQSSRSPAHTTPTLLFTGTMDYFPNTDAARYLAHEILPRVRARIPDVRTYIVGRNPPRAVRMLDGQSGVVVTGAVPDVRPYFERATVFVAPLRCGSGLQLKNLEAMAMRVPLVTTSWAADGFGAVPGSDFVCEDDPDKMAAHIVHLLRDADYREMLAGNGRAFVEREHSWTDISQRLCALHEDMVAQTRRNPAENAPA